MVAATISRITYTTSGGNLLLNIFGRDEHGKRVAVPLTGTVPYLYLDAADEPRVRAMASTLGVTNILPGPPTIEGRKTIRVETRFPYDVPKVRREFGWSGEADIVYSVRTRVDYGLTHIELPDGVGSTPIPVSQVKSVKTSPAVTPRNLTLDIEVNDVGGYARPSDPFQPVLSTAFYDSQKERFVVLYVGPPVDPEQVRARLLAHVPKKYHETYAQILNAEIRLFPVENEHDLFGAFGEALGKVEPDFIGGWNSYEYDFPYLGARAARLLPADPNSVDLNRVHASFDLDRPKEKYHGIQRNEGRYALLDHMGSLKKKEAKQAAYSLEATAVKHLGFGKIPRPDLVSELRKADLVGFIAYNLFDVLLTVLLDRKLGLTSFMRSIAEAANVEVQDVAVGNSRVVDGALLTEARIAGIPEVVLPTKDDEPKELGEGRGGLVFEPIVGLWLGVIVLDLSSAYPSNIETANISFDSFARPGETAVYRLAYDNHPGGTYRRSPLGLLPRAIRRLRGVRDRVKKDIKKTVAGSEERKFLESLSTGLKYVVNAFFGVMGSAHYRLANSLVFNDITGVTREQLRHNKRRVEDPVWMLRATGRPLVGRVIYGDTDSVMLTIWTTTQPTVQITDTDELFIIAKQVRDALNASYVEFFAPFGITSHISDVGLEGIYERLKLLPLAHDDGEEGGASKRYFGLYAFIDEEDVRQATYDARVKIRGVEARRFNNAEMTIEIQNGVIERTLTAVPLSDIVTHVKTEREASLIGERDNKLLIRTKLGKPFQFYGHSTRRRKNEETGVDERVATQVAKPPFVRAMENYSLITGKLVQPGEEFHWAYVSGKVSYKTRTDTTFREFAIPLRMTMEESRAAGFQFDIDRPTMVAKALDSPARMVCPEIEGTTESLEEGY